LIGAALLGAALLGCGGQRPDGGADGAVPIPQAVPPLAAAPAAEPRVVTDFDLKVRKGQKSYELTFIYNGKDELFEGNFDIQTLNANASVTTTRQIWSPWRPGEEQKLLTPIELAAREVHLKGVAYVRLPGGEGTDRYERVYCTGRWDGTRSK
jgi:hypothetical protein